jgi:hypothetical protein
MIFSRIPMSRPSLASDQGYGEQSGRLRDSTAYGAGGERPGCAVWEESPERAN